MHSDSIRPVRLQYMDVLKGIAIFMVVMGHVLTMCVREIDRTTLFKFVGEIHMPLFFFISGWFTLKIQQDDEQRRLWKKPALLQRAKRLIIPMLFMSTLWVYYFPHSGLQSPLDSTFEGLWFSEWKNGYWFTLVLFEVLVIYYLLAGIVSRMRGLIAQTVILIITWALLLAVSQTVSPETNGLLMLSLLARFFPVFMAGVLASAYRDKFERLTQSSTSFTISLIFASILLYFICWPWEFESLHINVATIQLDVEIARSVFQILLAYIAITVVKPWCSKAIAPSVTTGSHKIARMWQFIGKESLTIYLMHYFFLFPMGIWRPALESVNLGFVPCLVFAAFWSFAIIAVVLTVNYIIQPSCLLSFLIAGREKH